MLLERCPKCNAKVAPADTQCLDCGEDLMKHREELRKAATAKRYLTDKERAELAQKAAAAAARGKAFGVETSEETRLRTFDKHEAERTQHEMATAWVTAGLALIVGLILLKLGLDKVKTGGGMTGLQKLSMASLRDTTGLFSDPVVGLMGVALGIAGLLAAVGQTFRALTAHKSIAAVARGEKPEVVSLHPATRTALIIGAVICPPLGFVAGLLMKMGGRDEDTKSLGGAMLLASGIALVFLAMNFLWGLAAHLKPPPEPTAPEGRGAHWPPPHHLAWLRHLV